MSTESERFDSISDTNASKFEVGNDQISETLADPLTGQAQELIANPNGDEQEGNGSLASGGENGMEKINRLSYLEKQTESVNGGLDLGIGTKNVGEERNESEKKVLVDSEEVLVTEGEKDSDGIEKELQVEKEVEPDMVCSHSVDLSDVKVSDVRLDREEVLVAEGEKDSDGIEKKLQVEKEVEPDMVCSHGADIGDVKVSDVRLDSEEVLVAEGEKDSDGIEKELQVEKEVEPDMVCSHGVDLSDVKVSDVRLDSEEVLVAEGEKDCDGIEKELQVEKEVEPDVVCSHGATLSDVKVSDDRLDSEDLVEDRRPNGPEKQGTKDEDLDVLGFMGLEPDESRHLTEMVEMSDSDLVWAKVRSHPWWPGQVFDASAATEKAKKYFKKGSFLVTYFGDCTFAWNDASRIKPFRQHFSQMAKQSSLPDFIDAIDFALEEVSRRIEFGLACSCISEEVYQEIKTQNIINPGIREDSSSIDGGDKVSSAIFFKPANLVEYVKHLACSPSCDATDALQLVSQKARLLAFNRWKGYTDLPEFETLQGSVESAPKMSPAEEESGLVKVSDPELKKSKQVYTKRRKTEDQDDCKQEGVFEYEDTTVPKKKKKTLAEFIAEKRLNKRSGSKSHENSGKIVHCENKRKVEHSKFPKSTKKTKADLETEDPGPPISPARDRKNSLAASDKITPEKARKSFGIGASILKVANQMQFSTPTRLLPCNDSTSKKAAKSNSSGKSPQEKPKTKALSKKEKSPSSNETLSSPHTASVTKTPRETSSTNLVEDPMLESRDMKDSSKEQIINEDSKEATDSAVEITIEDSNLTEEKNSGLDLKEQPSNKNCSDESDRCKEDVSAE